MCRKGVIEEEQGIGTKLIEILKDWIRDNNVKEPTISKDDLEGFRCSELLVDRDHSVINFRFLFKAEHAAKASHGWKNLKKIMSSAYMKNSEDRETLDKSDKNIKK